MRLKRLKKCNNLSFLILKSSHLQRMYDHSNMGVYRQGDMQLKRAIQHGLKRSKKCNNISVEQPSATHP
jgi:hypothetical protein